VREGEKKSESESELRAGSDDIHPFPLRRGSGGCKKIMKKNEIISYIIL
jgi:hypothetical protein